VADLKNLEHAAKSLDTGDRVYKDNGALVPVLLQEVVSI
jgi:hypothetical protein